MSSCRTIKQHIIRRQDNTFIYWYDVLLHRMTRRHFYLLPHIIPVNNPLKAPGDFQKNPPYPGVLNVQFPAPIPRHGVGSPGDKGAPTLGLSSLNRHQTILRWRVVNSSRNTPPVSPSPHIYTQHNNTLQKK